METHTCSEEVTSDPRNAGVKSLKTWLIEGMYGIKGEGERKGGRDGWKEEREGGNVQHQRGEEGRTEMMGG